MFGDCFAALHAMYFEPCIEGLGPAVGLSYCPIHCFYSPIGDILSVSGR